MEMCGHFYDKVNNTSRAKRRQTRGYEQTTVQHEFHGPCHFINERRELMNSKLETIQVEDHAKYGQQ